MTEVYSDVATKQNTPDPTNMLNVQRAGAKVYCVQAEYEADGLAADDIINVCKLRKGDEVLPNSFVMFDDLGEGTSLDLGDNDDTDAADPDRYADGIDTATAAGVFQLNDVVTCMNKFPYAVQKDCWLQATNLGAAATGTLKFTIFIARAGG